MFDVDPNLSPEEADRLIHEGIDRQGLGPITGFRFVKTDHEDAPVLFQVELKSDSPRKARALAEWINIMEVRDATTGKFRASDRELRLNLRGFAPGGTPVVVVAPYNEDTETEATDLIALLVEKQHLVELVTRLVAIETRPAGRRA